LVLNDKSNHSLNLVLTQLLDISNAQKCTLISVHGTPNDDIGTTQVLPIKVVVSVHMAEI